MSSVRALVSRFSGANNNASETTNGRPPLNPVTSTTTSNNNQPRNRNNVTPVIVTTTIVNNNQQEDRVPTHAPRRPSVQERRNSAVEAMNQRRTSITAQVLQVRFFFFFF